MSPYRINSCSLWARPPFDHSWMAQSLKLSEGMPSVSINIALRTAPMMIVQGIFSYEIFYIICIATVKLSILLFYRRIFPVRAARIVIYGVLGVIFVWTITALNIVIFQCRPVRYFWDRASIPGMCMDEISAIIGISIPNIVTDFILLFIPLPLVWRLRIPRTQKLAVTGAFLLGGL